MPFANDGVFTSNSDQSAWACCKKAAHLIYKQTTPADFHALLPAIVRGSYLLPCRKEAVSTFMYKIFFIVPTQAVEGNSLHILPKTDAV